MKPGVMILGLVAAGAAVYFWKRNQAANPSLPYVANGTPANPSQPSQMYPFTAPTAQRADNANQPWYNGSSSFMTGPAMPSGLSGLAVDLKAGSSIVHSLSDVWGDMSALFGSNTDDPKSNLIATDDWLTSVDDEYLTGGLDTNDDWSTEDADWEYYNEWA